MKARFVQDRLGEPTISCSLVELLEVSESLVLNFDRQCDEGLPKVFDIANLPTMPNEVPEQSFPLEVLLQEVIWGGAKDLAKLKLSAMARRHVATPPCGQT
ncbi:MAG: hypothetical protein R3D44_17740 [Hyphomicrobiaceae bacterium]